MLRVRVGVLRRRASSLRLSAGTEDRRILRNGIGVDVDRDVPAWVKWNQATDGISSMLRRSDKLVRRQTQVDASRCQ